MNKQKEVELDSNYKQITSEERRAPEGKYRVVLNDRSSRLLYLVGDYDSAEEACGVSDTLRGPNKNGIVTSSTGLCFDPPDPHGSYMRTTREDLMRMFGGSRPMFSGEESLTCGHIAAIEKKQAERNPGWKPGHKLLVFWNDIAEATGARAYLGDL